MGSCVITVSYGERIEAPVMYYLFFFWSVSDDVNKEAEAVEGFKYLMTECLSLCYSLCMCSANGTSHLKMCFMSTGVEEIQNKNCMLRVLLLKYPIDYYLFFPI